MTIKLYLDHISQPSRSVHLLLLECGLPFTLEVRQIAKGEHRSPEIKAINPNCQLPCIKDGDFSLFESHTIMRYLCDQYQLPDHWFPRDIKTRANINQYLDWHHSTMRRGGSGSVSATLFAKFLRPNATPEQLAEGIAEAKKTLKAALKRINDSYLAKGPYLMGAADISIADLSAVQEIVMLDLIGFDYLTDYPNIKVWVERVRARTAKNWAISNAALDKLVARNRAKRQQQTQQASANKTAASGGAWSSAANALQTGPIMTEIASQLTTTPEGAEAIKKLQATFKFVIEAQPTGAVWLLDLKNGVVKELTGGEIESTKADSTFTLSDANFVAMATGKLNPQVAFMGGKLKLGGNLPKAMAFNQQVFQKPGIKKKIQEAVTKILPSKL